MKPRNPPFYPASPAPQAREGRTPTRICVPTYSSTVPYRWLAPMASPKREKLPFCQEVDDGSIDDFGPVELHPVASPFDAQVLPRPSDELAGADNLCFSQIGIVAAPQRQHG